jgi:hypothetical protein
MAFQMGSVRAMAALYRAGDAFPAFGEWSPHWLGKFLVFFIGGLLGEVFGLAPRPKQKAN